MPLDAYMKASLGPIRKLSTNLYVISATPSLARRQLVVGTGRKGLPISVLFPLTPAFSPLLILWTDTAAVPKQDLFLPIIEFRFARTMTVKFSIAERPGRELLTARPASV